MPAAKGHLPVSTKVKNSQSAKSSEFVHDSDDTGVDSPRRVQHTPETKSHKSKLPESTVSVSKKKSASSKQSVAPSKSPTPSTQSSNAEDESTSSEEESEDEEDEEGDNSGANGRPRQVPTEAVESEEDEESDAVEAKTRAETTETAETSSSSEEESEEESPGKPSLNNGATANGSVSRKQKSATAFGAETESASSEAASSHDEADAASEAPKSSSEDDDVEAAIVPRLSDDDDGMDGSSAGEEESVHSENEFERPRVTFEPPSGFMRAAEMAEMTANTKGPFRYENLQGKEIWQITAPSQAPFESVKRALLATIAEQSNTDSGERSAYVVVHEGDENAKPATVLLPQQDARYRAATYQVTRTLNVRRRLVLPIQVHPSSPPANGTAANTPAASPTRIAQPANLRMHYNAFGVTSDTDSDNHRRRSEPAIQPSPSVEEVSKKKKRKRSEIKDQSPAPYQSPKKKKRTSHQHAEIDDSPQSIDLMKTQQPTEKGRSSASSKPMVAKLHKAKADKPAIPQTQTSSTQESTQIGSLDSSKSRALEKNSRSHDKSADTPRKKKKKAVLTEDDDAQHLGENTKTLQSPNPTSIPLPESPIESSSKPKKHKKKAKENVPTKSVSPSSDDLDPASIPLPESPPAQKTSKLKKRKHELDSESSFTTQDTPVKSTSKDSATNDTRPHKRHKSKITFDVPSTPTAAAEIPNGRSKKPKHDSTPYAKASKISLPPAGFSTQESQQSSAFSEETPRRSGTAGNASLTSTPQVYTSKVVSWSEPLSREESSSVVVKKGDEGEIEKPKEKKKKGKRRQSEQTQVLA